VAYVLDAHNRRKNAIGTRFRKVIFRGAELELELRHLQTPGA
jgi:hypothetical protein